MGTRGIVLTVLLTAAVALLSACGAGETTTTAPPTTATTLGGQPGAGDLPDGTHFGFVRGTSDGALVFDLAEFLTGEEAVVAAREAGVIGEGEDLPNDFFIANPATDEVMLEVAEGASFTLIGSGSGGALEDVEMTHEELVDLLGGAPAPDGLYGFVPGELPMELEVSGGVVSAGAQAYLP